MYNSKYACLFYNYTQYIRMMFPCLNIGIMLPVCYGKWFNSLQQWLSWYRVLDCINVLSISYKCIIWCIVLIIFINSVIYCFLIIHMYTVCSLFEHLVYDGLQFWKGNAQQLICFACQGMMILTPNYFSNIMCLPSTTQVYLLTVTVPYQDWVLLHPPRHLDRS